ncbi:hypothetical protein [Ktedonospora formicarum]|uniref:Uncharacterized protein n=1 Tax=Ktedonospora formicarum TaxID=2778364 RepID=A0A8J3MWW6_9CHLR|nr:hypothetical protein [Ktedonospora formicarum]GHO47990.1 hypothetical protein KSX_61530 [Ktedonospora formicarum]
MTDSPSNHSGKQPYSTQYWIERLGEKVDELLSGIEISELTSRQRLEFAIKYLGVLQNFQSIEEEKAQQPQENEHEARLRLEHIKSLMRSRTAASAASTLDEMNDNQEA